MKKNHYAILNKVIKEKKANGQYVIERSDLEDYIDLSSENEEEKDRHLKMYMSTNALNQANYRSFVKGYGIFIDSDAVKSRALLEWLITNVATDKKARTAVEHALTRQLEDLPDENEDGAQLAFDIQDSEIIMFSELSKQEVLDLIRKLQGDEP